MNDELIRILVERVRVGRGEYGEQLHTHNGRDPLRDAIEELADAAFYLAQWEAEQKFDTRRAVPGYLFAKLADQARPYSSGSIEEFFAELLRWLPLLAKLMSGEVASEETTHDKYTEVLRTLEAAASIVGGKRYRLFGDYDPGGR